MNTRVKKCYFMILNYRSIFPKHKSPYDFGQIDSETSGIRQNYSETSGIHKHTIQGRLYGTGTPWQGCNVSLEAAEEIDHKRDIESIPHLGPKSENSGLRVSRLQAPGSCTPEMDWEPLRILLIECFVHPSIFKSMPIKSEMHK